MKTFRKIVVLVLLPLVVLGVYYRKEAYAFVFPVGMAAPAAVTLMGASGAVLCASTLACGAVALVGAVVLAAVLGMEGDTSNEVGQVRVPLADNAASTAAIPAPDAPGTAAAIQKWACSSAAPYNSGAECIALTSAGGGTQDEAGAAECSIWGWSLSGFTGSLGPICSGGTPSEPGSRVTVINTVCPPGYSTPVGGTCTVLTDARAVTQDKKQDWCWSAGHTLELCSASDQVGSVAAASSGLSAVTASVQAPPVSSPLASAVGTTVTVTPTAAGGTIVDIVASSPAGSGGPATMKTTLNISPDNIVTQVATVPSTDTLAVNPTTGQYSLVVGPSPSSQPIEFPNDYAREVTVAATRTATETSRDTLSSIHTSLTDLGFSNLSVPDYSGVSDIQGLLPDGMFSDLRAWAMPARSVECPTWQLDLSDYREGWVWTIDAQCTLWNAGTTAATVQAIALLTWAMMALFIVLSA